MTEILQLLTAACSVTPGTEDRVEIGRGIIYHNLCVKMRQRDEAPLRKLLLGSGLEVGESASTSWHKMVMLLLKVLKVMKFNLLRLL